MQQRIASYNQSVQHKRNQTQYPNCLLISFSSRTDLLDIILHLSQSVLDVALAKIGNMYIGHSSHGVCNSYQTKMYSMKETHDSSDRHQLHSHSIITCKELSRNHHHIIHFYWLYTSQIYHWIIDLTTSGNRILSYRYSVLPKCLTNGSINTCKRWRNSVREL